MENKLFEIIISNPMSEETFYTYSPLDNPLMNDSELMNLGFVRLVVSRESNMIDTFDITISPKNCSYIKVNVLDNRI